MRESSEYFTHPASQFGSIRFGSIPVGEVGYSFCNDGPLLVAMVAHLLSLSLSARPIISHKTRVFVVRPGLPIPNYQQ